MYYSLLSLILLNHLHHRKFDYCLISSYFSIYQLFFLSVICWQTAKGLINTLMINPHWFPLIGSGFRKNILWGVYITQIRGLLMLNSRIFRGKHTSFVALTSTFNIMLIHMFQEQNICCKKSSKGNNSITCSSMDFFNVVFILLRY